MRIVYLNQTTIAYIKVLGCTEVFYVLMWSLRAVAFLVRENKICKL